MVIKSPTLFARARGPDRFWKRRRIFSLSAHYYGRRQNCYVVAIRQVQRALAASKTGRRLSVQWHRRLWHGRLDAGCLELGITFPQMKSVLDDAGVALDRKIMQKMAVWEPRSFRALAMLSKAKQAEQGLNFLEGPQPVGVVTRGML